MEVELPVLRFGYGEMPPWYERTADGFSGEVGPDRVVLRGPALRQDGDVLRARVTLRAGERADYVLQHAPSQDGAPDPIDPAARRTTRRAGGETGSAASTSRPIGRRR